MSTDHAPRTGASRAARTDPAASATDPASPSMPSAPPKADIISLVRPSRSSSLMPIFFIISSTGLIPSSLAHLRQRPSFLVSPPSMRVTKITATFLWQREQSVGCIRNSFSGDGSRCIHPPENRIYHGIVNW